MTLSTCCQCLTRLGAFLSLSLVLSLSVAQGAETVSPQPACPDGSRIVSQSPYLTLVVQWLGRGGCLVGVSRYDKLDLPHTGGVLDPDGAAIAKLHPTVLLAPDWVTAATLAKVTPAGAQAVRLGGFGSVADMIAMMEATARAIHAPETLPKIQAFQTELNQRLAARPGKGRRVLLLSACSGAPYAYGPQTLLGDLFARAGFEILATDPRLKFYGDVPALAKDVAALKPELVLNFSPVAAAQCSAALGNLPARIVTLPGDDFAHPGPRLLRGLDDVQEAL